MWSIEKYLIGLAFFCASVIDIRTNTIPILWRDWASLMEDKKHVEQS